MIKNQKIYKPKYDTPSIITIKKVKIMENLDLEHVMDSGNFAENITSFKYFDSIEDINRKLPTDKDFENKLIYTSLVPTYSIDKDGNFILELNDLNSGIIKDKARFVGALRNHQRYLDIVDDLEDKSKVINLSDEKFNKFVSKYLGGYNIEVATADLIKGKEYFEGKYGNVTAKFFEAVLGPAIFWQSGIVGEIAKNQDKLPISFESKEGVQKSLSYQEPGTKYMHASLVSTHKGQYSVSLDDNLLKIAAFTSGYVQKTKEEIK